MAAAQDQPGALLALPVRARPDLPHVLLGLPWTTASGSLGRVRLGLALGLAGASIGAVIIAILVDKSSQPAATPAVTASGLGLTSQNPPLSFTAGHTYLATITLAAPVTGQSTQASVQSALPASLQVTTLTATPAAITLTIAASATLNIPKATLTQAVGAPPGSIVTLIDQAGSMQGIAPRQLSANYNSTGTTLPMFVGDGLRTSLPVNTAQNESWSFTTDTPAVVSTGAAPTQAADPVTPGATDQIDTWTAAAVGTTVIKGQNKFQSWKLTCVVSAANPA